MRENPVDLEMRAEGKSFRQIGAALGLSHDQTFRQAQIARQKLKAGDRGRT
jgi:DNA-binding CsgD family transcriptional regulator